MVNFCSGASDKLAMKNFLIAAICFIQSNIVSAQELSPLLTLKPGHVLLKAMPLAGTNKTFSYEIEKRGEKIHSISIEFKNPIDPSELIKPQTEGHCKVEKPEGHVVIYRHYFFDMNTKRRYELNPFKKISKILIQDMPGAIENPKCKFESFKMREVK